MWLNNGKIGYFKVPLLCEVCVVLMSLWSLWCVNEFVKSVLIIGTWYVWRVWPTTKSQCLNGTLRDKGKAPTSNNEATKNIVAFYIVLLLLVCFLCYEFSGCTKIIY